MNGDYSWMDFAFDDLGRTVGSLLRMVDGMAQIVVDSRSYGWDARHNRTGRVDTRSGGPETAFAYEYDGLSRLTESVRTPGAGDAVTREYALDAAGSRDTVTVTVGQGTPVVGDYALQGDDALVNAYTVTPFEEQRNYDANGNLVLRALGPYTEEAFFYDYRNLLTRRASYLLQPDVRYKYDALGRRIEKTVGEDTTRYVYHGARVIEERDGSGGLLGSYVYGKYLDEVLTLRRGTTNYFLHSDAQWNTVALTDASGYPVERYEYGDYGQPEFYDAAGDPLSGSTVGNPCLFTGQRYDAETGLYWYKSRYFDPQCGRFTTRDPLGPWGDPLNLGNPYTYTGNNPWSYLDPYGLCGEYNDFSDEWWGDFWDAFYDLTIGDPFGYAGDSLDVAQGYAIDAPLELLQTAAEMQSLEGQLNQIVNFGSLGYNLASDFGGTVQGMQDAFTSGVSDWYNGWFDPRQGGQQAFDIASGILGGEYVAGLIGRTVPAANRLVIGRGDDLARPGMLGPGEFRLSWPFSGSTRSEWRINSGLLRQEMRNNRPIRDASPGNNGGMYLNAERYLLQDRGWIFDRLTSLWLPPAS